MTLAMAQAATEYILIVAHQAAAFIGTVAQKTAAFVGTPRGIIVASMVAIFLALSIGWRRPPRM
jgi:hypothetical protein